MGIPHKNMNCKLIIFSLYFILSMATIASKSFAYDSIFVVEGVEVDETAQDSVTAQDKAFEQAQLKAFNILSQRMVDDQHAKKVKTPDSLTISSLIKDYEVTNEKLSAIRYVGTYTFRFREKEVSNYFAISGVSFTNISSDALLVLPVLQRHGKNTIWSEDNIWLQSWSAKNLSGGLVPIEVPIGDLADIADIADESALTYNRRNLDRMLRRYGASEATVMVAVPDLPLLQSQNGSDLAKGAMRISVYRTDRARAEHVKDINIQANGSETRNALYARAVDEAYSALQKDWKAKTLVDAGQTQNYTVLVSFKTIKQWSNIRQALLTTHGLSKFQVKSLKKNEAVLSFSYFGDEQRLREALSRDALILGDAYQIPSGTVYDLKYGYRKKGKSDHSSGYSYQAVEPASGEEQSQIHTF